MRCTRPDWAGLHWQGQGAPNFSLKLLVCPQGAMDMLVFLRAENGWCRFEVPIGKDQPFMLMMTKAWE